jgi:hypothetical protein
VADCLRLFRKRGVAQSFASLRFAFQTQSIFGNFFGEKQAGQV